MFILILFSDFLEKVFLFEFFRKVSLVFFNIINDPLSSMSLSYFVEVVAHAIKAITKEAMG